MNTEWLKLRPFNGDIKYGFEELVCQLARAEKIKYKSKFVRVDAPDGGVEAYSTLKNGKEYGWQAKYFSSIGVAQWKQLDKSFKSAFKNHPKLIKYYICTPLDLQGPKGDKKKWLTHKWNDKTKEWMKYATKKGRKIKFEYWGNSELFDRLGKPENEGKLYYWFNKDEFSENWFKEKLEESIRNLDKRYTPECNFDLPVAKIFEGIARDTNFKAQFVNHLDALLKIFNKAIPYANENNVKSTAKILIASINKFKEIFHSIDFNEVCIIDQDCLSKCCEEAMQLIEIITEQYIQSEASEKSRKRTKKDNNYSPGYGYKRDKFIELSEEIYEFQKFITDTTVNLSNNPFLLLTGEAGIGKSHLLADITKKRLERNQYTILLLGQHFNIDEPWTQIKRILHLNCERDVFLSALNAKAESVGSRILFFIDAINEGEGKTLWKNYIGGFITTVRRFPYLGVVFSIRTSYERLLIPETLKENKEIIKVVHIGFANHEYEASKLFFDAFEINQPSIPLLHPEFSNPLFLKLFCEGLFKKRLHEIPDGYEGISTILNFYLDAINESISTKHNIPVELNLIQKIIKQIAEGIAESKDGHFKYDEAFGFITSLPEVATIINKAQFFLDLISEGLLTRNLYWDKENKNYEGVYITYERFSDHLVASYIIEKYIDKEQPKQSFELGTRLYKILENQNACFFQRGLIEALSIQLPEIVGYELYELADYAKDYETVAAAFVENIIWRKKEYFTDKNREYINSTVIKQNHLFDHFIDTILLVTAIPNHYYNSDYLHKQLLKYSMADRDSWWTQFIHDRYPGYSDNVSPIKRMIDWGWTEEERENISDESIRLMCQTMFWFLSSTNRTLRDSASKALVCLLEERINVLIQLINTFHNVNDPYVIQRLYAVAYGCAVRTSDIKSLKELGDCIFQIVFNSGEVIPDILLRDYARGVIEYAAYVGHKFDFDLDKIRPPFKSDLPSTFPSNSEINKYEFNYKDPSFKDYYWGQNSILGSMAVEHSKRTLYGDFGRYVFESGFRYWKNIDTNGLSNLAIDWIFKKYGYDVEKHGAFDRERKKNHYDRHYVKEERIGKKYQWIAYYELLARVSDNYAFIENSWSRNPRIKRYEGPWNPYVRDIDPTVVIKRNPEDNQQKYWWNQVDYDDWNDDNKVWLFKTKNIPNPINLITFTDPKGQNWLNLKMSPKWNEETNIGENKWDYPHKDLWYNINGYITTKSEYKNIVKWAKNKILWGGFIPETVNHYEIFSREYYWSPACATFRRDYDQGSDWSNIRQDNKTDKCVGKVALTTVNYLWEEEYDASKEETIRMFKPTEILFKMLGLKYSKKEGQLLNNNDEVICFDPATCYPTDNCLLVRKKDLLNKLDENGLKIFWTIHGEKMIMGGGATMGDFSGRLVISRIVYFEREKLKYSTRFIKEKPGIRKRVKAKHLSKKIDVDIKVIISKMDKLL